jgi:polar amino acid transport system substrate-binding protein
MKASRLVALLVVVVALLAGCSAGSTPILPTVAASPPSSSAPATTAPALAGCSDANSTRVASYAPTGSVSQLLSSGQTVQAIKARGRLIAGVSADNLLFGFRDPISGNLVGFDIDMVSQIAKAIFGTATGHVQYVVVSFAQRIPALTSGKVDLIADIMTINCARWGQINFSSEYFHAGQQVMVRRDSTVAGIEDLNGNNVCTAKGSTSSDKLASTYKQVKAVLVDDISDCMVLFQQSAVDAVMSDNTVVAGFVAQDPYAKVVGPQITDEPYGLGIPKQNKDFVQFVNAVLAQMRTDGSWAQIYTQWLKTTAPNPPVAVYGRQ